MVTGTCYVVARPLNAALRIRREEREMAYGRSKAKTIRRRRARLKGQPQERSLIAGAGSTRSRRPRWACLTSFRCRSRTEHGRFQSSQKRARGFRTRHRRFYHGNRWHLAARVLHGRRLPNRDETNDPWIDRGATP